jgi:hypothetical protein
MRVLMQREQVDLSTIAQTVAVARAAMLLCGRKPDFGAAWRNCHHQYTGPADAESSDFDTETIDAELAPANDDPPIVAPAIDDDPFPTITDADLRRLCADRGIGFTNRSKRSAMLAKLHTAAVMECSSATFPTFDPGPCSTPPNSPPPA